MSLARMAVADRPCPVRRCDTGRRRRSWLRVIGGPCQALSDQGAQRPSPRHPERPARLRRQRPLPTAASLGLRWRSRPKLLQRLRVRQREPPQVHQRLTGEAPERTTALIEVHDRVGPHRLGRMEPPWALQLYLG